MIPEARIARVSWWQRLRAQFDVRSKAELLALVEHEREHIAALKRELSKSEDMVLFLKQRISALHDEIADARRVPRRPFLWTRDDY